MRLHRLELTAFGPFPGTAVVDFDRLNDAGLFLLTGPTGAGKTSILDAICFALYGAVPGHRNGAKAFKSHHADADAVPSVTVELTIRGRNLRVHRQPAWSRPSRRARSGVVEEKAKATAEERIGDRWQPLSTRVDEVGHLVSTLLGMNKDQFCQVVMLPQGQFQTFLSSGAKERHDVLESLFRTHRFAAIERWLVDRRRALDSECRQVEAGLDELLARADEVLAGADAPLGVPEQTLTGDEAAGGPQETDDFTYPQALELLRARSAALSTTASTAADERESAAETAKQAQHSLDTARALVDLQRRHREAQNRWQELAANAAEVRRREREVLLARRASAFEPLLDLVAETEQAKSDARLALDVAAAACWRPADDVDLSTPELVEAQAAALRADLARLDALQEVQSALDRARVELADLEGRVEAARRDESELVERLKALPEAEQAAGEAVEEARQARTMVAVLDEEVAAAARARAAAEQVVALDAELAALHATLISARETRADARELLQGLRERRIAGMAAHLASGLSAGNPCPVCGSIDHPQPAESAADVPSEHDEHECADRVDEADAAVSRLELQRERLRSERTAAGSGAGGLDPAHAAQQLLDATQRRDSTAARAEGLAAALEGTEKLRQLRSQLETKLTAARETLHTAAAQHAERSAQARSHAERLEQAIGSSTSLTDHRAAVAGRLASTQTLAAAVVAHQDAAEAWRDATARLDRLVADSVFATVGQVRDAVRREADIASGEALNRTYAADRAAADRLLNDPALVRAGATPVPDLEVLGLTAEQTAATAGLAATRSSRLDAAASRLDALVSELGARLEEWSPLRERRDVADHLASMVSGTSRDNPSKTRLSHYVLAARLEQVVAAANLRLAGICSGRYELEHTLTRGVGDTRGGLGLRVLDTYTGSRRDPATLSGGETFYVSLALALGLADLVNNEIGGAELSTLFVDEGFGSLDADTLDEVMDELDALRSGGRSVGLVSHLAELRLRVPTQLSVVRSPRGSRLDDSR